MYPGTPVNILAQPCFSSIYAKCMKNLDLNELEKKLEISMKKIVFSKHIGLG